MKVISIKRKEKYSLSEPFPKQAFILMYLQYKSFKNIVAKGKIAPSQCFQSIWRAFCDLHEIKTCCLQTLSGWKSLKFVVWKMVNASVCFCLLTVIK